jgi:STE24 endopeptidase
VNAFTGIFLAALAASIAVRLWLAQRQVVHVRAHRGAVPATFVDTIPLDAHQKAADYTVAKSRLGMADMALGVAVLLAFTLGGGIEWLSKQWAHVLDPAGVAHGTALIGSVVILMSLIELPMTLYRTFVVEQRFGFNRMTWKLFFADLAKHTLVETLIGLPLVVLVLWLMAQMGEAWWLWVWGVWVGFSLLFLLAYPRWIMPLFNKFSPVTDTQLVERIERLLARCGFRSSGLSIMDGSKRSAHGNAFFVGLGSTKRIVLFDTLVERLQPQEVEAVLAHELGHFKLKHVTKMLAINAAFSLSLLWILGRLIREPWFFGGCSST